MWDVLPRYNKDKGERYFREIENDVIAHLPKNIPVIALGGGAIFQNYTILQKLGALVYLDAPYTILQERNKHRAFAFDEMYAARKKLYEAIPAHHLKIEGQTDQEIIQWLATLLEPSFASPHGESPMEKPLALSSMDAPPA